LKKCIANIFINLNSHLNSRIILITDIFTLTSIPPSDHKLPPGLTDHIHPFCAAFFKGYIRILAQKKKKRYYKDQPCVWITGCSNAKLRRVKLVAQTQQIKMPGVLTTGTRHLFGYKITPF
jgi:hypothetical protein